MVREAEESRFRGREPVLPQAMATLMLHMLPTLPTYRVHTSPGKNYREMHASRSQ